MITEKIKKLNNFLNDEKMEGQTLSEDDIYFTVGSLK